MQRRVLARVVLLAVAAVLMPARVWAHNAHYAVMEAPAVVVEFFFTSGTPMAYASIKLFPPHDAEHPYQTGRTDESGRFAFVPAYAGMWTVEADDGMGHRRTGRVEVAPNQVVPPRLKAARRDAP